MINNSTYFIRQMNNIIKTKQSLSKMKQHRANISRIALSDMIHITRKDSAQKPTLRPKTANNKISATQQSKRTSFIFIKNRQFIVPAIKQYEDNINHLRQNLQSKIYNNNYKAFPKRLLVKSHQRSHTSSSMIKPENVNKNSQIIQNSVLLHLEQFSPVNVELPPEKKQSNKKGRIWSHRRAGSLYDYHRKGSQSQNYVLSPWQFPENQDYKL